MITTGSTGTASENDEDAEEKYGKCAAIHGRLTRLSRLIVDMLFTECGVINSWGRVLLVE